MSREKREALDPVLEEFRRKESGGNSSDTSSDRLRIAVDDDSTLMKSGSRKGSSAPGSTKEVNGSGGVTKTMEANRSVASSPRRRTASGRDDSSPTKQLLSKLSNDVASGKDSILTRYLASPAMAANNSQTSTSPTEAAVSADDTTTASAKPSCSVAPLKPQGSAGLEMEQSESQGDSSMSEERASDEFNWDVYLRQVNGIAAPPDAFHQDAEPPTNKFVEGTKLEMPDPRGSGGLCLATIEQVHKIWIYLRLDGCDGSNDFWLSCDNATIHPVGFSASQREPLAIPIGYQRNIARFQEFVDHQLSQPGVVAPANFFKPRLESSRPKENLFEVGYKLEAVDLKNFSGLASVASVVGIEEDILEINFDGWSFAYNVKLPYYSRDIFPIGWCKKADIVLQPPPKLTKKRASSNAVKKPENAASRSIGRRKSAGLGRASAKQSEVVAPQSPQTTTKQKRTRKRKSKGTSLSESPAARTSSPRPKTLKKAKKSTATPPQPSSPAVSASTAANTQKQTLGGEVALETKKPPTFVDRRQTAETTSEIGTPDVKQEASAAPAPATASVVPLAAPRARKTVSTITVKRQEELSDLPPTSSSEPSTDTPTRSTTAPTTAMLSVSDIRLVADPKSQTEQYQMSVQVNRGCACGVYIDPEKLRNGAPRTVTTANVNHVVRECIQILLNAASQPKAAFNRVEPDKFNRILTVTADIDGYAHVRAIPSFKDIDAAWTYLGLFLDKLGACPKLLSRPGVNCIECGVYDDSAQANLADGNKRTRQSQRSEGGSSDDGGSSTLTERDGAHAATVPPSSSVGRGAAVVSSAVRVSSTGGVESWTVDQVAASTEILGDASIPMAMRTNLIDGRALLLLNADIMLKHMGLRLGPALKVAQHIGQLKSGGGTTNSGAQQRQNPSPPASSASPS